MILINKGQNNTIVVTLSEKTTLSSPTYLFKFTNDVTGDIVRFIAQNTSDYTYRYDKFLVTETDGTLNLTSGVIELSPSGFWSYQIYEQTSTTNLDENLSTGIVETGKVKVIGDNQVNYTNFDNQPNTFITYGG
jgi:hypothetical protein